MKAILYNGFGDTSVLKLQDVPAPTLSSGKVRIEVAASGLNRADLSQRRGDYPPPPGESDIPGLEVSGTIRELAPDAHRFRVGDKVMALLAGGGYASEVCVDEGLVAPLPPSFSFEEGAATMEAFLTAHHNLFSLGQLQENQDVLLHAGASGVGTAGIQLLVSRARHIFVTVGSQAKAEACRSLGATPILYREEDFVERTRELTGSRGVDLILDPIGASYLEKNLKALTIGGTIVNIGLMGGREAKLDLGLLMQKRAKLIGSTLRALPLPIKRDVVRRFLNTQGKRLAQKDIRPLVDKIYPVADAAQAQQRMEENLNIGKIVLTWK